MSKILLVSIFVLSCFSLAIAQNKFEGFNIILDVPETQRVATCATRFAPPTTNITITDLNPQTPLNVRACDGSGTSVTRSGSTATMRANSTNFKWCFQGEDKKYRISFSGDQYSGNITYEWIATLDEKTLGFYNIKDFGAVGDGHADDTIAIKSAMAFLATRNGGTLSFPEGEYLVNSPVTLPSGIVIQGTNGLMSFASTSDLTRKNPSRITLVGTNRALFRVGECVEQVSFRDIELNAQNNQNTYGVEAVGGFVSAQGFNFDRVTFNNFFRGIYARGLAVNDKNWQFDYVKVNQTRFLYNSDAGIYCDTRNSDWKIEGSLFINPRRTPTQKANSMHFERVGMVLIQDTFGGGFVNALGGTFINVLDSANITVIGSQTEAMTNSFVYNEVNNPYAGDQSYPVTFINCIFGDPIIFKARRTFVSTGSLYGPKTFQADERLRVYSTGDRFCYDGYTLGCTGATKNNFDRAQVIFMTAQPDDRNVPGHPTIFGTDVQFGGAVQMPSFMQNALPTGKANGSMVYCSNCKRNSTPCQSGGTGAPAMVVANQWSCL
ncbi:MAG TPA: glycosyl hydrolase family 28-related protein [Pyrinomonadaceae bacterium]|jgi:hypothetical protein